MGIFPVERMMVSAARQGEETPAGPVPQLEPVPGAPWEEAGGGGASLRMSCGSVVAQRPEGRATTQAGW